MEIVDGVGFTFISVMHAPSMRTFDRNVGHVLTIKNNWEKWKFFLRSGDLARAAKKKKIGNSS